MLAKAIAVLLIISLLQFVLLWTLTHLGIVVLGATGWGLWTWWSTKRRG